MKVDSFRTYCVELEGEGETLRLCEILKRDDSAKLDYLRKPNGTFKNSRVESGESYTALRALQNTCPVMAKEDMEQLMRVVKKYFSRMSCSGLHFLLLDRKSKYYSHRSLGKTTIQTQTISEISDCHQMKTNMLFRDDGNNLSNTRWSEMSGTYSKQKASFRQTCRAKDKTSFHSL